MSEEFNLSDKRIVAEVSQARVDEPIHEWEIIAISIEDVKEFIRRLKEGIRTEWKYNQFKDMGTGVLDVELFIDKLAGDKLSK